MVVYVEVKIDMLCEGLIDGETCPWEVRGLPIPSPFPNGKGLLLCDESTHLRDG